MAEKTKVNISTPRSNHNGCLVEFEYQISGEDKRRKGALNFSPGTDPKEIKQQVADFVSNIEANLNAALPDLSDVAGKDIDLDQLASAAVAAQ